MGLSHNWSKHEAESLLSNVKTHMKLSEKCTKHLYKIIIFGLLLLGAIYLLYVFIHSKTPPEFIGTTKLTEFEEEPKKSKEESVLQTTEFPNHIRSVATTNYDYLKKCAPQVNCNPYSKYRNTNGSCNNLEIPTWGASKTPFFRLMNANYNDGYYALRLQTNWSELPNARLINTEIFLTREVYRPDENNVLLVPFGQLIAIDISGLQNDLAKNENGDYIDCCNITYAKQTVPQCQVKIDISPDDLVYSQLNRSCMSLYRALTSRNYSCPLQPTTFININTHFIDASEVYGSDENTTLRLRTMEGGRLNFSVNNNGQMFCPYVQNYNILEGFHPNNLLYDTGNLKDGNQNLGITSMQTLFLRFHNQIAWKLSSINPHWSDEIIFQEARRILIATKQRIAYEHFLPTIIGEDFQESYGLNKENIYDPSINPSISQEFSTAAYRVLHNIIPVQLNLMDNDYQLEDSVTITDWMAASDLLPLNNNFDKLLKGFLETPGRIPQHSYNFYLSNFLFNFHGTQKKNENDMLTVDIMRGRDTGLQPYNRVRHLCGLPLAKDFEDLLDLFHVKDISKLKEFYHSVDDIDLIVGLLLEKLSDGAMVGPTTRCLIADSFYRLKAGDRFFYDVKGQPGSFTPDQLKTIKKITLGHIICTSSKVDHVQKDIFKFIDHKLFSTSKLKCGDEFSLDFKDWAESKDRPEL